MTRDERQMITGLFDRMRSYGTPQKDREAEAVINEAVRSTPDAAYMLVQSVLVQEHALQEAGNRIKDLEEQVRSLQGGGQERAGSGSFLGGLFGGGRPVSQPGASSVPVIGSRAAAPPAYDQAQQRPWAQAAPQQQSAPPASGGFMRSAMATAAGVAGGMLAAGAIRDLMGGNANANTTANTPAANPSSGTDTASTQTSAEQAQQDREQDARQDASDDDSSWGDSGGDLDI